MIRRIPAASRSRGTMLVPVVIHLRPVEAGIKTSVSSCFELLPADRLKVHDGQEARVFVSLDGHMA